MSLFPDMAATQQKADAALMHVAMIQHVLEQILKQGSPRESQHYELGDAVTVAPGAIVNAQAGSMQGTRVPLGKRFVIQRVATTAPAATGPCAIYATTSGQPDPGNLREVIPAPSLYADAVASGTIVRGGACLLAVFNQVPATGGICTIRYEGILLDDTAPEDLVH